MQAVATADTRRGEKNEKKKAPQDSPSPWHRQRIHGLSRLPQALQTHLFAENAGLHHLLQLGLADVPLLLSPQQRPPLHNAYSKPPAYENRAEKKTLKTKNARITNKPWVNADKKKKLHAISWGILQTAGGVHCTWKAVRR